MSSSSNNGIDPFPQSFPFSFLGHDSLLIPPNPNFLQNDIPNFVEPFSNELNGKCFSPRCDLPMEIPRKRKETHSKINTARGPRERRVRLSLNVAQRFFDLQDMLGFDQASKTLDWLLGQSHLAIEELKQMNNGHIIGDDGWEENANFHTSKCEVLSDQTHEDSKVMNLTNAFAWEKTSSKSSFQLVGRESRVKARERARKRTKEKMGMTRACDKMHLGSSCPNLNQIEASYSETMMVNCSINEQNSCSEFSQAQRTYPIEDSNSMKPFTIYNRARSSNDYQNWETIDAIVPRRPFCYQQTIAPPETQIQRARKTLGGQQPC